MTIEDAETYMHEGKAVYFYSEQDQTYHCGTIRYIQDDGVIAGIKGLDFPGITGIPVWELKTELK